MIDPPATPVPDTESVRAVVVPAEARWGEVGGRLCRVLGGVLGAGAVHVRHIGSTAVPGMAAKEVFDLQVSVRDLDAARAAFAGPLERLGFRPSSAVRDHAPAGLPDRPEDWAKALWTRRPAGSETDSASGFPEVSVNLHVRLLGGPGERIALLFRDWFRAHPEAVPAYAAFKRGLAAAVPDTGTYAEVKDPVVDLVIAVAEPWAEAVGWAPHEGARAE
ncbi:GrpB family protein [Streptomyces sp. BI20]|uniref:GrpB family protein n=1 Tax=Streptomyces sp. BI20 TaxID=3403460 RepID=UPI003C7652AD